MLRWLLAATMVVCASAASASDPVAVEVERHPPPNCLEPVPGAPCLVGHTAGQDEALGDDTFYTYQHVERVTVRADAGVGPPLAHEVDLAETQVEHPLGPPVKAAEDTAHAFYPDALAAMVDVHVEEWGVRITRPWLHYQTGELFFPETGIGWVEEVANYTHLKVPYTTYLRDSDYFIDLHNCPINYGPIQHLLNLACDTMGYEAFFTMLRDTTPNLIFGAEAHALALDIGHAEDPAPLRPATGSPWSWSVERSDASWNGPDPSPAQAQVPTHEHVSGRYSQAPRAPERVRGAPLTAHAFSPSAGQDVPWLLWLVIPGASALAVGWLLYHRILGRRALEHPMRQRLHAVLREQPGLEMASLARELGLAYHTAAHHVGILRRAGLARTVRRGRRVLVFLEGEERRAVEAWLLRQPTRRAILLLHRAEPGLTLTATAARLGLSKSTVHGHFQALRAAGLLGPAAHHDGTQGAPARARARP